MFRGQDADERAAAGGQFLLAFAAQRIERSNVDGTAGFGLAADEEQFAQCVGVRGKRVAGFNDGLDAGGGQLGQRGKTAGEVAAVYPDAFGGAPYGGVGFAGWAGEQGFGQTQGAEACLAECGGGGEFLFLGQRQAVQQGFQFFQRGFVGPAGLGELGLYPVGKGPPALGPVPERPWPPKGCTPTTAPTMLRLT